ncbi:MAG: acyltransferase family protein [Bacteroidales bacterium]|nr:acyltransferase family protein [Bacteroidales bacterium]
MTERNQTIDLFRLLAAFCVICIHVNYTSYNSAIDILRLLTRWAVPYFFIVSGYSIHQSHIYRL